MSEKPYTLCFMLKDTQHKTFADAFKAFYKLIQENHIMSRQVLETACWIKHEDDPLPCMIYDCIDRAYKDGLLKDGNPTWED